VQCSKLRWSTVIFSRVEYTNFEYRKVGLRVLENRRLQWIEVRFIIIPCGSVVVDRTRKFYFSDGACYWFVRENLVC
jgi:hypothetical protein